MIRTLHRPLVRGLSHPLINVGNGMPLVVNGYLGIPGTTVARNSLAWDWNSQGLLQQYAINQPVIGYNPATGALRGLQVEKAWVNSQLNNRDISLWGTPAGTRNAIGLDGAANTAWTISPGQEPVFDVTIPNDSNTHTRLAYLRKGGGSHGLRMRLLNGTTTRNYVVTINTTTGGFTASGDAVSGDVTVTDEGDWWKCTLKGANNTSGNTLMRCQGVTTTAAVIYDFGGVYLNSSIAGPPIVTGASAVTREADNISGSLAIPSAGSLVVEFMAPYAPTASGRVIRLFSDDNNHIDITIDSSLSNSIRLAVTTGNVGQANASSGVNLVGGTFYKAAVRWETDNFAISVNGNTPGTDTSGTVPSMNAYRLGRRLDGNQYLQGYIRNATLYQAPLPNAQLQALSA